MEIGLPDVSNFHAQGKYDPLKGLLLGLASRKFMLSVLAAVLLINRGQSAEAVAVVIAYLGVEGAADYKNR